MVTIVIAVLGLLCTVVSVYVAWASHRQTQADRVSEKTSREITDHIDDALHPVIERIILVEQQLSPASKDRDRLITKAMINEALEPVNTYMTTMGVKVETLWNNLAASMAQILHQPDPARRMVDRLLESFMSGTLTNEERIELRKCLFAIKNWEPGSGEASVEIAPGNRVSFPVHNGEQVAAGILLLTMDEANLAPVHGGVPK
jgi:hypothetical protein